MGWLRGITWSYHALSPLPALNSLDLPALCFVAAEKNLELASCRFPEIDLTPGLSEEEDGAGPQTKKGRAERLRRRDAGILRGGVLSILTHQKARFVCQEAERLAHNMAGGESKQVSGLPSSCPGFPVAWVPHTFHVCSGECRAQKCHFLPAWAISGLTHFGEWDLACDMPSSHCVKLKGA